jgi:hypothetical protein
VIPRPQRTKRAKPKTRLETTCSSAPLGNCSLLHARLKRCSEEGQVINHDETRPRFFSQY